MVSVLALCEHVAYDLDGSCDQIWNSSPKELHEVEVDEVEAPITSGGMWLSPWS